MPIYSYMRLSTDEDKQSNSFEIQSQAITTYAKANGLEPIVKTFKDTKSGAKLEQRLGLMELLNTIKKDDKVIVQKIDRLSRDVLQMGWIRTELARKGCELVIIDTKNDNNDPMANLMEQIVTAFADYERQMIKSRIQATMDLKKSKGEKLGGAIPFGFDVIEQDKKKVLFKNDVEQKVVASIKRYKSKGLSLGAIAKKLNERGITTKNGKEFQSMQVKRILDR
ncbi:recombinase family protein [Poseidonibacter antarcticus]|uniref:recombinase family protein n=1 Tax=Poseidonibacter antarcticus TaxID=2478538 RepID=UPI000EF46C2E|nr:recombinase family protein [Poseidonibacter antarcticus]